MQQMCPVMLFFIAAGVHQLFRIKFLEKALAKLEFLQKAKKLVKQSVKKSLKAEVAPVQSAPQTFAVAPMPVLAPQKKSKKVVKQVQPVPQLVQPVIMPVVPVQ